jgi:hypothetical protein
MSHDDQLLSLIAGIDDLAAKETIFRNPSKALPFIEQIFRTRDHRVINSAHHVCRGGECVLERATAVLYRRRSGIPAPVSAPAARSSGPAPASTNMALVRMEHQEYVDMSTVEGAAQSARFVEMFIQDRASELVHICVPHLCIHLVAGHSCDHTCPHRVSYSPADTYTYPNLFVCTRTGNVHSCGVACRQRNTTLGHTGRHICPLTNIDLGSQLESNIIIPQTAQAPLAIGYVDNDAPLPRGRSVNKHLSAHDQGIQRRRYFLDVAQKVAYDLLCSRTRQTNEIALMRKHVSAFIHDVHGIVKRKPKAGATRFSPVFRALQTCYERWPAASTEYFSRFALNPDIRDYAQKQVAETVVQSNLSRASHLSVARDHLFMTPKTRTDIDTYQRRIRDLVGCDPPPTNKYTEADAREEAVLIAKAVVALYENIVRFSGSFYPFKTIFVHLIYIMRYGHRIPVASGNLSTACSVVVIPRFPILELLPAENTLSSYASVREHACTMRSVNAVSKSVYEVFNKIAQCGAAYEYEINIEKL